MDGEAGWWTTSGNIGLPPLARAMGVGRQQHLMLFLSQSQQPEVSSCESTVNGLAASAASMKTNIAQVENIIKKNNSILAKQNDTVLKLIHEISANVN